MLSKIIAHGADRAEALHRLDAALRRTVLLGLGTNIGFLRALLADPDVRAGNLDTGLVGRRAGELAKADLPDDVVGVATGDRAARPGARAAPVVDPFDIPGGWRVGEHAWTTRRVVAAGHDPVEVRSRGRAASAELVIDGGAPAAVSTTADHRHTQGGITRGYAVARGDDGVLWVSRDGRSWAIREQEALEAAAEEATGAGGPVLSPMPGHRDRGGGRRGPAGGGGAAARRGRGDEDGARAHRAGRRHGARAAGPAGRDGGEGRGAAGGGGGRLERGQVQDGRVSG